MRQLWPGGLVLSPGLRLADPAAIGRWSASTQESAHALNGLAGRLAGLVSALPGGLWVSPAASVFDGAGLEQARRLRVVAGLFQELAAVGTQLASELAQAREQALAATESGARLDADVLAFNDRMRAQHALLPQDPDSLLVDSSEADQLSGRLAAAEDALSDAEARARKAWQAAAAGFDLVSYATPAMRQRMSAQDWDPAKEVSLAAAGSASGRLSCGPMEALGLPVNGILTGPDRREYPLVVQSAWGADGKLLVTTQEPAVELSGWTPLAIRIGTTVYGRKAATWEKVAVALGGAAGASYPQGSTFAPDLLSQVHIMAGGGAYLSQSPPSPIDSVKEASAEPLRGEALTAYWVAPDAGIAAGRRATAPDAIGLLDGALGGYLMAQHLDDGRAADYRVVFEENTQGQLRARLQLFRVLRVPGEQPATLAAAGYVDDSGQLAGIATTGEAPGTQPVMIPAPG
ncbi:MAG TPA: hypothetical protein VHZ96_13475 [Frankiaceae bacterium]|jgi:hypothetical protein|nr:hypothetical protein [Frankiaceae bacterium]